MPYQYAVSPKKPIAKQRMKGFIPHIEAPLVGQVLHFPTQPRESDAHHHRHSDDLGAGLEVPERAALGHAHEPDDALALLSRFALTEPSPRPGDLPLLFHPADGKSNALTFGAIST